MASTDFLGLNDHKLFKNVRDTLPNNIRKTQDVLTIKDDVLFTWDFQDNCILTLNIKAARSGESNNVRHQTLLPQSPPLFTPSTLLVNESSTLAAVVGLNGVLVIELPSKCPPYGAFDNNKELIYCRSFSLHEWILAFSNNLEVRTVRFHPASLQDTHILVLTSDNLFRLCNIDKGVATSVGVYPVGIQPMGRFPTTKTTYLEALGDVAIDFDFGPPELKEKEDENKESSRNNSRALQIISKSAMITTQNRNKMKPPLWWPIFVLYGNGDVFVVDIEINGKGPCIVKGPLPVLPDADEDYCKDACSILCIPSTPPVLCIANCNGTIYHSVTLQLNEGREFALEENRPNYIERPDRALYVFESVELELGLSTTSTDVGYSCPIFLHKNQAKTGHYFATHETGVHSVNIPTIENMHRFVTSQKAGAEPDADLFDQASTAEYVLCTKTRSSEKTNAVIGFSIFYEPLGILVLLANGQLVSLALTTFFAATYPDNLDVLDLETMTSPLKKMLSEPFDLIVQRILKQSTSQPILKLSSGTEHNQQECYELLQRAAQVFREEHFKNHNRARDEIEKRMKTLIKLKQIQKDDIQRMNQEKQALQEKAENLAEKYEDTKDKQEELMKRCEKLLLLISKRQAEPSHAEKNFLKELNLTNDKVEAYKKAIAKLRNKILYQDIQMKNWNKQNEKENILGTIQTEAIKSNLQNMTNKITSMMKEVNDLKKQLNLT